MRMSGVFVAAMPVLLAIGAPLVERLTAQAAPTGSDPVSVDGDIPGGNVRVLKRDADTFFLAPDLRDTEGWWFHFHFRLRAPAGRPVTIVFPEPNPIGVRGPAVSHDEGSTWQWLGRQAVRQSVIDGGKCWSFDAVVPAGAREVRFAFAPVYRERQLRMWLAGHRDDPDVRVSELCRSRKNRSVELIRAGCMDDAKAPGIVLLTARHHACESMASHVLEGILSGVLADDDCGRRWRERWQVIAAPFMDKDGVEDGDQGKNRRPHDHNRDYGAEPIHPEVAAWKKMGEDLRTRVVFSLDLHCPYIRGEWNDRVYLVGSADGRTAAGQRAFAACLERARQGPIPFRMDGGFLPSGVAWNKPGNESAGRSNGTWACGAFPAARFTGTMEIAYADAGGAEVSAESARLLGRDLARAILSRLENDEP